jgi:predicted ATPase
MNAPPSFAGRVDELQFLFQGLGRAAQGQPQVIFLEGAPGVGKSALLQSFGVRAAHREKSSYTFYILPPKEGEYRPIPQAAVEATNKQLYDRVGGRRKAIDAARDLLPDWLGAIPGIGDMVAAVAATVQALRRRRLRQGPTPVPSVDEDTESLLLVAARRPLVVLLDDLHHADADAVAQIERLIRATAGGMKLLLVGAYQPTPAGMPDPPIHRLMGALPQDLVQYRKLKELNKREVEYWLKKRFPHVDIPASFLRWLFEQTGGHAAAVESLLTRLIDRSVIRFVNRRWEIREDADEQHRIAGADSAAAVSVDLSAIGSTVVEVLQAASILGDDFDGSTLAQMLEKDELYVEDQLALAAHHKLVRVVGEKTLADGEIATLFRFASSHLRSVLARELPPEERAVFAQRQETILSRTG